MTLTEIERETKRKENSIKSYEDNIQNTNEKIRVDRHTYRERDKERKRDLQNIQKNRQAKS